LICIFFMARDAEHFFICSLAICTPFENRLFSSFSHLFRELLILWEVSFLSFLYILTINPLSNCHHTIASEPTHSSMKSFLKEMKGNLI
jgi:hypothetical protein